jgi:iron complex outermembrane recepter protein
MARAPTLFHSSESCERHIESTMDLVSSLSQLVVRNGRPCLAVLLCLGVLSVSSDRASAAEGEVAAEDPWAGIEELVVTSSGSVLLGQTEKTSVLGFDAEELFEAGITDIGSLAEYTPNLEIKTGASAVSSPTIFIRGIGLLDFNSNASSSVAIYNDGVYMNSPLGQLFQFFDLEGVEVLRGPQGSLHARNATAGAIRITPRKPDGEVSGSAQITYGNYDAVEVEAAMGVPIVEDILSARVAARFAQSDGYTENRCRENPGTGSCTRIFGNVANFGPVRYGLDGDVNNTDNWAGRFLLRYQPTEEQDWVLGISGGQSKALAYQFQSRAGGVGSQLSDGIGQDRLGYADRDGDPFAGDYDLVGDENLNVLGVTLNGDVDFEHFELETTTGYALATSHAPRNFDASPNQFAESYSDSEVWQISEELAIRDHGDGRFSWELGGFAMYELLDSSALLLRGIVPISQDQHFEQRLYTWAFFGNFGFELTESFEIEGGIRYNWERKEFDLDVVGQNPGTGGILNVLNQEDKIWDEPTGEIVGTWSPTESISVYAKYTHGFKGGHFNGGAIFSAQSIEAVDPEIIDSFEVGLKSEWLDGMLTLNFAAWYYDYSDYQVFAIQNSGNSFPLPQLLNAPRVESRGVEMDAIMRPIERLELRVSLGILDAEFTDFTVDRLKFVTTCPTPPFPACPPEQEVLEFSGNPLVAAPPLSLNLQASYDIDLGLAGTLSPRIDASFRDKTYFVPGNQSELTLGRDGFTKNEGASQDPYWLLNLRLSYKTLEERVEVALWVRNVADVAYLNNSLDATAGLTKYLDVYGPPRTYGVTGVLKW